MKYRIPLSIKKYPIYDRVKRLLPSGIRGRISGNIEKDKANLLVNSVEENKSIIPSMMTLELTNHCNAKCTFCTQPDIMQRPKTFMLEEVLDRCVEEIKKYNISEVMLAGMGEPFMYKKVLELIRELKSMGVVISVTTNGSLLFVKKPEDIVKSGLDYLLISMDALDTGWLQESKPGIKRPVDKIEADIKAIYDAKKRLNSKYPWIRMKYQILDNSNYMSDKEEEKRLIKSKIGVLCDEVDLRKQHDWLGEAKDGVGNHTIPKATMDNICNQLVRTIEVGANGDVGLCCMDFDNKVNLGNIMSHNVEEIYNSTKIMKARKMYVNGTIAKHPMCKGCYS